MATSTSIATTTDRLPTKPGRRSIAHKLLLIAVAAGGVITSVATIRLAAVTATTPTNVWENEYSPLVDAAVKVDPARLNWARSLSSQISDAGLFRATEVVCFRAAPAQAASEAGKRADQYADCLLEIDHALQAAPSNGELWLFKATTLAADGEFGQSMMNALRNSYRTAPVEGWIASMRVVFGMRLFPALPPDLQEQVASDLQLVLNFPSLSKPLITAYTADSAMRVAAAALLRALPIGEMQRFVHLVRAAVPDH